MSDREVVETKMLALISEAVPSKFRNVSITAGSRLKQDLGLDSIAMLALIFRFEECFDLDLATVDIDVKFSRLTTVGSLLAVAHELLDGSSEAVSDA